MSGRSDSKLLGLRASDTIGDWIVMKKLGRGGCGAVFEVCTKHADKTKHVAMKVESRDLDHNDQLLRIEASVLKRMQYSKHVPVFIAAGRTAVFNFLLMELLGKSLSELHKIAPHRQFTIATVLKIALQALNALRDLHNIYFIHRDVKPGNFASGLKNINILYILDFGLSRQFATYDTTTKALKLRKPRARASFRGTVAYCSVNVHKHLEQGRHDDLWSMMYMLIEFIVGRLPWKGLDRKETAVIKQTISNRRLLQGCPKQFGVILEYISLLRYHHRPDYDQIENLFVAAIQRRNIDRKAPFEWGKPKAHEYISHMKAPIKQAALMTTTTKQLVDREEELSSTAEELEATLMEYKIDTTQCT
ncbi:CK1 protein kinase [Wuchereria bancrofti]|uniref:CK1 protein kinase n=2 Tax=Wuchereria bancrofti TaxID=6293 RepID=J9AT50_WUCBA|nr:CK1 protein kinase [Wuchereria bancrofti]